MKAHLLLLPLLVTAAACSSSSAPSSQPTSGDDGGSTAAQDAAAPDGGDTWASWGQGFFATYCVECHGPSDPTMRDYTKHADVVRDKDTIRCGVAAAQSPAWSCPPFPPPRQFPITDDARHQPQADGRPARARRGVDRRGLSVSAA